MKRKSRYEGFRGGFFLFHIKKMLVSTVIPGSFLLRSDPVSISRARARADACADQSASFAAENTSENRARSAADADIKRIAMTAINRAAIAPVAVIAAIVITPVGTIIVISAIRLSLKAPV